MKSTEIVKVLSEHLPQGELAQRSGFARETVSRWAQGVQQPSLEALEEITAAAGFQLDVRLLPADAQLVEKVHDLLEVGPTDRLKDLLGDLWPACRSSLRAAAAVGDIAVLVGPLAAALSGAPLMNPSVSADLVVDKSHREEVLTRLHRADARPAGPEIAPAQDEQRERWTIGQGAVTVRWELAGIDRVAVHDQAHPAVLNAEDIGVLKIALVEDLLQIAVNSPWPEDAVILPELRAVLASGRYSSRKPDEGQSDEAELAKN